MMNKEKAERELKLEPNKFLLKKNPSAKTDVWNGFRLLFRKDDESDEGKRQIE